MTENSGLSLLGTLTDNSQVYQLEVRMADAMCSNSVVGSCSIVNWTAYSISSGNIGSQADFNNELPIACGSQCNADANSACATSCSTCDGQQIAGENTPITRRYKMGTMAAKNITFSYETYRVKDRITVSYEGQNLFDSGCVGTEGEKYAPINFEGNSVEVGVDVEPNCEGTPSTGWYFTLPCVNCQFCQEYQCLDDSKAHCGPNEYLIHYGLYFCNRFNEYSNSFNAEGQAFIECVRPRLLDYVENYLSQTTGAVNCDDLHDKAFDSHFQIYSDCNFCIVFLTNELALTEVIYKSLLSIDAWKQIEKMVVNCGAVYGYKLCEKFPNIPCICKSC